MKHPQLNQRGVGHVGIIAAVVVALTIGFAGWFVWQKNNPADSIASKAVQDAVKNAKCTYDKDLCKFYKGWKAQDAYEVKATSRTDDTKTAMVFRVDGDKTYVKVSGGALNYETITIGNDVYTKATDGTWWKQTVAAGEADKYKADDDFTFADPASAEGKTTYKKIGKEKCGDFTCFKYQLIDPAAPSAITHIWFDDDQYLLRGMQTEDGGKSVYDAAFSYENISVSVPKPVKELGPNQYLVPGQNEPATLPATGDESGNYEELLRQYQEQYNQ